LSKILKASYVKVEEKINIEPPVFEAMEFPKLNDYNDAQNTEDEYLETEDTIADNPTPEEVAQNIIDDAKNQAKQIIEKAEIDAEELILNKKTEFDSKIQEEYEKNLRRGYEDGLKKAFDEVQQIKDETEKIKNQTKEEREQTLSSLEPDIVNLISDITHKILFDTVTVNPKVILNLVRQGLAKATVTGNITIRVSESEFEAVSQNKAEILKIVDSSVNVDVAKDLSLKKGDCIIETNFGNIDCSLGQQFEGLKQNLYYILENR